ncbi:peptidase M18 aminopeptidase I [Desulfofarcimen acetoxidans DSM 771]|uniref:M18 family aminopeptidase n=1 Tax=Desulfofarcimen acetoxidans (strain ATCC 49208 / DSM 771 / KCTC 5769 / VKM B-1644 / 5575) TaxID=485916 RepID=C8W052_DESAS|nr:aminopeptidase [Desulfofarcimen acetoxidans]ACV65020.1 peptidase M18 aminopeptidase I [Desulfofarcimen acetoxidans DSM 771]
MANINGLFYERKNVWERIDDDEKEAVLSFCEDYKIFLNKVKTEREAVQFCSEFVQAKGFKDISTIEKLKPGDSVFVEKNQKALVMAVIGSRPIVEGLNLIGAHIDSPRLDLKPQTLFEKENLGLLKTHYYGGIKKYQWTSIPLSLHGVIIKSDGSKFDFIIGEKEDESVFTITDLLPHLAKEQMEKKMSEAIPGESLNILCGSNPVTDKNIKEKVKAYILEYLYSNYGIIEEDFISAEIEAVPAWGARDIGFDRSLIGSYGQDDRVCAFTSMKALVDAGIPETTSLVILADKEEIGSNGNTGMMSTLLENSVAEIAAKLNPGDCSELLLRRVLAKSKALSADVNAGLDPNYEDVMEKMNAAKLGYGLVITKYTGSRGKSSSNDANAEFIAYIRNLLNKENIIWQTGELGKIDQGGGGTIAYLMAASGMDVVDCGVALLGMHSTFEVAAKTDIYMAYKGYKAFFNA